MSSCVGDYGVSFPHTGLAISAYKRIPLWIRLKLQERGLVEDCLREGLSRAFQEWIENPNAQLNQIYNASKRGMRYFIKVVGFYNQYTHRVGKVSHHQYKEVEVYEVIKSKKCKLKGVYKGVYSNENQNDPDFQC